MNEQKTDSINEALSAEGATGEVSEAVHAICKLDLAGIAKVISVMQRAFNISAAPASFGPSSGAADAGGEEKEEKNSFKIKITNTDSMEKLNAVKVIRQMFPEASIKEASDLLKVGTTLDKTFSRTEAEDVLAKLSECKVIAEKV